MKTSKSIIVAYDKNRAIGIGGALPWGTRLPADLAHFSKLTKGCSLIMGRKTFDSLGSQPLPERENIVISSTSTGVKGVLTALDFESALALARYPLIFIGGQSVYEAALTIAEYIYATEVDHSFSGAETFFPELDPKVWQEKSRSHHSMDDKNDFSFDFVEYQRIK